MIEVLHKYHNEWKAMCLSLGVPKNLVEDTIHDMYIKLHDSSITLDKIMYNDTEPNKYYIYVTLRNIHYDYLKDKNKNQIIKLDDIVINVESDPSEVERLQAFERILRKLDERVDSWGYWYDRKLFSAYYKSNLSMRELASQTGISLTSIFNSCRRYKWNLQKHLGEDYKDYLNGDYDKIK